MSLDRFGRNYDQIKTEWEYFSKKNIKIKIIDMPLIDTTKNDLTSKLISDIVLQLLSYVAEMEYKNIHQRQAEGIRIAKEKGVKFGRPKINLPTNFHQIANAYCKNEITNIQAYTTLNMKRASFFRYLNEFGYKKILSKKQIFEKFKNNELTVKEASLLLKKDIKQWYPQYCVWKKGEV